LCATSNNFATDEVAGNSRHKEDAFVLPLGDAEGFIPQGRFKRRGQLIKINRRCRNAAIVSVLAFTSIAVHAATIVLKATLKASSEVPPTTSKGIGTLSATLNTTTRELTYRIVFSGLTGPATMAHFHGPAKSGANAGVLIPIGGSPVVSPIEGTATLTPDQMKIVMDGESYVNIHTAANPGGEIRGQVSKKK
jgi:hypothetical protein